MKTIFTEIRRWLSEPVLAGPIDEPQLSPRDWSDLPPFHPRDTAELTGAGPANVQSRGETRRAA